MTDTMRLDAVLELDADTLRVGHSHSEFALAEHSHEPSADHAAGSFVGQLAGMRPERVNANVLRLSRGTFAAANGTSSHQSRSLLPVDMDRSGVGGLDVGTPEQGADYFIYLLTRDTDGEVGAVLSRSISYGGVAVPEGWTVRRKLPYGQVWPFRPVHVSHWPSPKVTYTDTSPWSLAAGSASATWQLIDLSGQIPDNARLAHLACTMGHNGGPSGEAFVGPSSTMPRKVSRTSDAVPFAAEVPVSVRVTSQRGLYWRTTGGATLGIQVLGYDQTEIS